MARKAPAQVGARVELELLGWMGFGWLSAVFVFIGGYYVLRFHLRRHAQSAFIAALSAGSLLFGASVVGLLSRTAAVALMLCDAAFGTLFLLVLVDELRRGAIRKGQGDAP